MYNKKVKDLMIPLDQYAVIGQEATLLDAINSLDAAQRSAPRNRQQFRAVLVLDNNKKIIGKVGHFAFLKALEPKYNMLSDMNNLTKAGLSSDFIQTIMDNYDLLQDNIYDICVQATTIKVKDIMHPVTESIDEDDTLEEAIHKIIMWESLSILVRKDNDIVGIIRLSDIFNEVASFIINCKNSNK
jgi:CBS domain-containing protein